MGFFDRFFPKSCSTVLHISTKSGFHLRPAAAFVAEAKQFASSITAETRGKSVDAKVLGALLSLNLEEGDHFELHCKGTDAHEAMDHLVAFFDALMQKEQEKHSGQCDTPHATHRYQSPSITVTPIAPGIAIAPLSRLEISYIKNGKERERTLAEAIKDAKATLLKQHQEASGNADADIFLAQHALLETLEERARQEKIETLEAFTALLHQEAAALEGGILASKKSDYLDLLAHIKEAMGETRSLHLPEDPFILLADDLLPSDIEKLSQSACQGVLLHDTSPTSHTAILLRNSAIPSAIIPKTEIPAERVTSTQKRILDTTVAQFIPSPNSEDIALAKKRQDSVRQSEADAAKRRFEPALTKSGKQIKILANVSSLEDAYAAKEAGAEGIGLLRTEFLFTQQKPSLELQERRYAEIFSLFEDITVRTLDVGGDKALPYLDLPHESNPFLGIRGVRLFKSHPALMEEQLLALFRAAEQKPLKIMFPMVSSITEFTDAKAFAHDVAARHGLSITHHKFGIMIEVPSTLFLIDAFDKVVDFYSIGTNDLSQYLYAIERTHPTLSVPVKDPLLLKLIADLVKSTKHPVSLCGELASETKVLPDLIETGIKTLSLSAAHIPTIKERIRHV